MTNDDIEEVFAGLGPVAVKRMFGGKGVYHQGLIVAVVIGGVLYLKGDAVTIPAFEAAGAEPWSYTRPGGKPVRWSYWSIPDEALDDPDVMAIWARRAFDAAMRAPTKAGR